MARILVHYILLVILFANFDCEVYQDRPKIKTSDGDLILEPAYDKSIYLRPNGPKSTIYVGEINILNVKTKPENNIIQYQEVPNNKGQDVISGPNGILKRLEILESKTIPLPDDLFLNISMLWRRVNNLHRKVNNLQVQLNARGKDECQTNPCQHGGTCLNLVNGYHCLCPNNWEGKDCDSDVNECRNFAGTDLGCQNGATCMNKPGYYECLCRSGWFGLHCTRKAKDCSGGNFEMCGHGTCLKVDTGEGVTCICQQGWTTNGTGVACLTDVNECDPSQGARCSVNPKVDCVNLPGSFRCGQCPPGYEGDGYTCSDIDECVTIPNGGCSQMVACHNTIGSRICGPCPPGYQGDGVTCTWKGLCNIDHGGCHPSAQCVENLSLQRTAQCICPNGMEGDGIGIHGCFISVGDNNTASCDNNPCGAHGQCHILRSGYTCICQKGYGGPHCDSSVNLCAVNPCRNGGICRQDDSVPTGFRCECTAQYSGPVCQVLTRTCGGVLDAEEGNIVYPITNSTYVNNARCAWVIHTVPNKVINVTFSKFDLEDGKTECPYDFLQIHDGRSSASQLIGRFCGNVFPKDGNVISSHNNLYFWFRSDHSISKNGFALHWTSIDPVCGGIIDAGTHGHISSPGSPGKYPPNRDCYWKLKASFGKKIQLHFFALDIEHHDNCSFDYLAIYDGSRETDPLLNKYCDSTQPAPLSSAGSDILIHFHSDASGSGFGFQLAYASIPGVPGCGGYFTQDFGEITAPTFNGTYMNNMLCEYKVKTSQGTKIRIDFKQFRLERSVRCRFDYLKIYDGPSEDSQLIGKFCGTTYPKSYTASSNTLFFRFRSDVTTSSGGFRISYEALCQQTLYGDSGVIKSPGYPFNYPENKMCEYFIASSPGKAIQLTFQDFDIEDNRYYRCQYDNVEIRDGTDVNSTLLGRYCGSSEHMPPVLTSTHNHMYVRFNSDMSITGTGFYANYTTFVTECGGIYKETTGLINHPQDGGSYKNDQTCTWMLMAPVGMHIKLTWHRFDLEQMASCKSDYLELIEIDNDNKNFTLGKYCGTKAPPALTTSTDRLMIKFKSDNSVRSPGFSFSYTFLNEKSHCDGNYYRSHGFINSPGWPRRYETNRDCTWVITVPLGQQIRLNISQFDLERPIRNTCIHGDFLDVRNGATLTSPLIGQYCGKFQNKIITSLANSLYLHFHSDAYLTGSGFQLEWDGSVVGCGGTLTSSTGTISSPNYPDSYNENSECFYKIVTSLGSRIRLSFTDLDLERTANCRDDYVEIFDGKDFDANSLGRFCTMDTGLNHIETTSNAAYIKFRSDSYINGKGFILTYFTVCNNNLTGSYGVIESPNYPNTYPVNLDCLWNIIVFKGSTINVTFTNFDVFNNRRPGFTSYPFRFTSFPRPRLSMNSGNCDYDYLQWKESTETKYSDKFCGVISPAAISSKTNSLQIKFISSVYGPRSGFRLEWVRNGCGGHIQKHFGSVSIDKNNNSPGEVECEWLIETPIGTSVSLVITDIFMTESQNCSVDSIEVYNGQNTKSPQLSKICNRQLSVVQSTGNVMLVKYTKRSALRGAYFTSSFSTSKAKCGGNLQLLSGYIYSKNYPKNYDNNLDCKWVITVPTNHRIELNFMDFDLYSNSNADCDDSIKIFDDPYLLNMNNYTSMICPTSNVRQITTKYNRMMIQFTSNNDGNAKGFKANFTVTCGAFITAVNDGIISNENYIGGSNKSCTWTILANQPDQKISFTITHLSLPSVSEIVSNRSCSSTYLRVFEGDNVEGPLIDEYCGKKVPPMIVSRGSAITVLLGSYTNHTFGHFSAHYSALSESCGGTFTSEEGTIASPNYPRSYPIGANCEWTLSTSPGNKVYVTFEEFDLEYSEGCNEDYLEIREDNGGGRLLGVFCGADIPTNTTTASKLYIKFHSSDKNNGKGFVFHYGFVHGNELINMESGEIASPLYPHLYHGSAMYSWRIQSPGTDDIAIKVDNLEIPSLGQNCYNYLSIYDGYDDTAPLLATLCGKLFNPDDEYQTSSNMAYIKLSLDESNTGSQFHLTWKKNSVAVGNSDEIINCGSNYTEIVRPGNFSTFVSPHYPENYENNLLCEWTYQATRGRHLKLNFIEFELEETSNCFADHVNIYSSDTPDNWKEIKHEICESTPALQVTNSSKYLKVKLRTDSSVTKKGFKGKVSSVCGGLLTDLSGEVGPTWDDAHVGTAVNYKMRCDWIIKVRPGRVINLEFVRFNISNRDDYCITSVTLKNGDSSEAPLLEHGKYCGYAHEKREKFTTSSNSLFISYNSQFKFSSTISMFQTFKIRYEEQNIECGLTSNLDNYKTWEVINSPKYPDVPLPFSECIWKFTGPVGEILRVDFLGRFDLDSVDGCMNEFVEVRDGSSDLSPSLGRFCGETPGTIKTTGNTLYVRYSTQISNPSDGFKANVSIDVCGGTIVAESGEIKSPGYPHMIDVPYGTVCVWRIKGEAMLVFNITTQDIDVPESETDCATKVAIEENIPGAVPARVLQQYCDTNVAKGPIETSTNEFVIKFHSGKPSEWSRGNQYRGFRFTFTSYRPTCGGSIRTPEGFLTTPGYPLETVLRYCSWNIMVPDNSHRIRLELIDADENKHTIGIYNDNSFQSLIQTIPGENYSRAMTIFESSGNKLSLFLWLNQVNSKHRFKAKFSSENAALCGGNINGIVSGEIKSPNIERSYSCEWHYNSRVENGDLEFNTILLTATVNTSVPRSRCRYSDPKLNIKAPMSTKQGLTFYRDLCGTDRHATYRIPSSVMDVKATRSRSNSIDFHLEYKAQPCGGFINVDENAVNILEIPYNVNDTLDCAWMITMPFNSRVELKMQGNFQFNCDDEFLKISQGTTQYSPTLGEYCLGKTLDTPLVINFRYIYIEYHIKATNSSSLKLMAKTVNSQCGGQLSMYHSTFSSPNYPKNYEPNQECAWLITADLGSRVSLRFFERFVVEDTVNCTKDAVIIYDWKDDTYNQIARLCGRDMPITYNSTYNKMKVVLRTDATTNLDGFRASWTPICGAIYAATDKKQTLYSPGYPFGYPSMSDCTYKIKAPANKKLAIQFLEFELEGTHPECQFDNVTVAGADEDGYVYSSQTYCGSELPAKSNKYNEVTISLKSDRFVQRKGFKLNYQIYECGGRIKEPTVLASHEGDDVYGNDMNCTWLIEAPADKNVVLKFEYIDLEQNSECYSDFVAVFDDLLIDDNKRLALLCGHINSSTVIRGHGNKVLLQFVSDQSYGFTGFRVQVLFTYGESASCGGRFVLEKSSTKTFKSPLIGTSVVYENYLDCHWTVTSPPDTVIQVEFVAFHISSCVNVNQTAIGMSKCDCDLVEIRDGLNPDSFIMGSYCGHTLPPSLRSSGNHMSIRLSTDGELQSSGFEARLSVQQALCGQSRYVLSKTVTRIKTPGYDKGTIPRGLHCVYYLDTNHHEDSTIRVSILNLDIQPSTELNGNKICDKDKFTIASNPAARNLSVGKDYILNSAADSFIASQYFYDVENADMPKRLDYCGSIKSTDVYITGSTTLELVTSPESDSISHKGLELEFAFTGFCGRNYTGTSGTIQTANYYRHYDYYDFEDRSSTYEDCFNLITAPENHTISLYFLTLSANYWNDDVYLKIFNGKDTSAPLMVTIDKDNEPSTPLFSKGRYILLHHHANENEHVQYEINYISTDKGSGCGGRLESALGRVSSPSYPDIYRQDSKCEWELVTPIGTRLRLHFNSFDLGRSCDQNYMQLVDSKGNILSSYCSEKPADYISPDNFVKIVFFTTRNNGGSGWIADFVGIK